MISVFKDFISDFIPNIAWGEQRSEENFPLLECLFLPETYLHEVGHSIAIKSLYSDSRTRIQLFISGGGFTESGNLLTPSYIGKYFTPRVRQILIEAAGPLVSVIYAIGLSSLGLYFENKAVDRSFDVLALLSLGNMIRYAADGMSVSEHSIGPTNDFAQLKKLGIDPIYPIVGMTAIATSILFSTCEWST